jgi:hypothetical protein
VQRMSRQTRIDFTRKKRLLRQNMPLKLAPPVDFDTSNTIDPHVIAPVGVGAGRCYGGAGASWWIALHREISDPSC